MNRDPFKIDGPTCISFSGGRTSAYMLHRVLEANGGLPAETVVCFANTGKEAPETLNFVRDCSVQWHVPIVWLQFRASAPGWTITSHEHASRAGEPFSELVTKKSYLPNPVARFCTSDLKIKPIEAYCRSHRQWGDFDMMVGIRADEPRRVAKMRHLVTPLASAGITKGDVLAFWKAHPFDLAIRHDDGITPLGNCDLCFLKGANQIKSLIAQRPDRAIWWAKQEAQIGGTFRSDRPSYATMHANALAQLDAFGHDEEAIACFCGD
jgi:3'-phosphoadenosine 5'-phosphosulfate sulfotransferase (PAPS reductase)/FAD synthetase